MGCFLACFGGDKDRKQRRRPKKSLPINRVNQSYRSLQPSPSPQKPAIIREAAAAADVAVLPDPREKQENARISSCRKKVTFDLNVKTYEDVVVGEGVEDPLEADDESKGNAPETVSPGSNYRYQNCESSDDECVDDDDDADEYDDDSDFDEEDDNEVAVVGAEEESYESFFSLPMDKEKQRDENSEEVDSPMPISVLANGGARDRSQYVHSVLNPVENLSQWKEAKAGALQLKNRNREDFDIKLETKAKNDDKENSRFGLETKVTGFSPEPTFKGDRPRKPMDSVPTPNHSNKEEISVDTSLSTWLVSSENGPRGETTPQGSISRWSNSPVSREEQPILGALTVEDLKQSSVNSSPRRSPIRTPDDIPILGTVGSYWSTSSQNSDPTGIPNSTSKYREDKKVNWHSTPFEVRLERALNTDRSC